MVTGSGCNWGRERGIGRKRSRLGGRELKDCSREHRDHSLGIGPDSYRGGSHSRSGAGGGALVVDSGSRGCGSEGQRARWGEK